MSEVSSNGGNVYARRVLVVDADADSRDDVAQALRCAGLAVDLASSGEAALRRASEFPPDLVVLEVELPDGSGFKLAQSLQRGWHNLPVVFLTARDSTEDRVLGLTIGGDDYLTKPANLVELVARVRAVLRRSAGDGRGWVLTVADLQIDNATLQVRRAGRPVDLTTTEYRLLQFLAANAPRVLTRGQIIDHIWGDHLRGDTGVLDTYISYLRHKIDDVTPHLIHTVRGVGFVVRVPREGSGPVARTNL